MSVNHIPARHTTRKNQPFFLPAGLEDVSHAKLPLYVLVALWALRQNRAVTVSDVRKAFGLSLRRAIDVLEYLTEQGDGKVEASCSLCPVGQKDRRKRREWRVTAVYSERSRISTRPENPVTSFPSERDICRNESINEHGRWFLQWRPDKVLPDDIP
ncbi:TPA: CaiF/GrlA family transcriptional regulator [Citrobacter freundii]|nr:CaiF/GrlA family transcriptional regulator [Citrobacter freundii]